MSRFLSGILVLDTLLGDGVPDGSLVEISGTVDSCKTALALWYCKTFQEKTNGPVLWLCTEANLTTNNIDWAYLNKEMLLVGHQTPQHPALELAKTGIEEGIKLIVIDSISALISNNPTSSLNSVLGKELPSLARVARTHNATVIMTNQERALPGSRATYTTGSGRTLNRLLDVRMKLRRGENLYRGGLQVGTRIHFLIQKNGEDLNKWGKAGKFTCLWQEGLRDTKNSKKED